jgi:hypothetical protein
MMMLNTKVHPWIVVIRSAYGEHPCARYSNSTCAEMTSDFLRSQGYVVEVRLELTHASVR